MKMVGREMVMAFVVIGGICFAGAQGSADTGSEPEAASGLRLQPDISDMHRRENMSFVVTCSGPQPQWLGPKGRVVRPNSRVSVSGNETYQLLVFTNVSVGESGNYTCKSKKDSSTRYFSLTVVVTVSFGGASQQTARQNDNATLLCAPRGSPNPVIAWLRNGKLVNNDTGKFVSSGGQLLVKNVTRGDAGPYLCRAIQYVPDESFTREHIINLTVQHGPEWHEDYAKDGDQVYGFMGGLANLTCVAEAQPVGNITWKRGKVEIKPGNNTTIFGDGRNSTLQLNLTNSTLFGDYTCTATNPVSTTARVLSLLWGERAPVPTKPQPMKAADARHALIRVDRPEPPAAPPSAQGSGLTSPAALDLTGLRLLVRVSRPAAAAAAASVRVVDLPFNEDNEYTLPDLQPNTWYEVRAQWRNAAGLSNVSELGEIHTSEISSSTTVHRVAMPLLLLPLLVVSASAILKSAAASILTTNAVLSSGAILSS